MLRKYINTETLIHSTKTAIACIIGFFVTKALKLPSNVWVVVSILVVMCAQINVGSVLQKAYLRFVGTVAGCLFSIFMISALRMTNISIALTIGIAGFAFSFLAIQREQLTYVGTLGAMTTTIIMLSGHPTVILALERFMEISIGILIATVVSQFILPIHARTHLRHAQAETLSKLRDLYQICFNQIKHKINDYSDQDEQIVKLLTKQRNLAKESANEHLGLAFNPERFLSCLYAEKEILRAINFMRVALFSTDNHATLLNAPTFIAFNQAILEAFNAIIKMIKEDLPPSHPIALPTLTALVAEQDHNALPPTETSLNYHNGFLFAASILLTSLNRLILLYQPSTPK